MTTISFDTFFFIAIFTIAASPYYIVLVCNYYIINNNTNIRSCEERMINGSKFDHSKC